MNVEETYKKIIYDWVAKCFGRNEADDPSWNIDALAKELAKHFGEMYWKNELENIKDAVRDIADEDNYDLTDKQVNKIAEEIQNSDWYAHIDPSDVECLMEDELGE